MNNNSKNILKAIIVDDEKNAIKNLQTILHNYYTDINIVATCNTVDEAYKSINEHKPDLVFLDIDLGNNKTAFDLLKLFPVQTFKIIFVTAFNDFAIKAIKYAALDYVLKPVDETELIQAVNKAIKGSYDVDNVELFKQQMHNASLADKIALNLGNSTEVVAVNDIISIEADKSYTSVTLLNKEKLFVSKSISEFEELLIEKGFYRIHKSFLINISHIKNYSHKDGGTVTLINKEIVPVSDRKKTAFFKKLDDLLK